MTDVWSGLEAPKPQNTVAPDIWSGLEASDASTPKTAGPQGSQNLADVYGSEAGPGALLTNPEFWKGAARGALGTFESATAGNQKAAIKETQDLSKRWGITGNPNQPEGTAGEVIGGFMAPLPGGPAESAAAEAVNPVDALIAKATSGSSKSIGNALDAVRDQVGPDVTSSHPVEHGDTIIQAYKDKAAVADANVSAKYKALQDANGGQFPVDAAALQKNATAALHDQLLFDHAPKPVMNTLGRLADNNSMTFENFESLRTNLARIQRSSSDANEAAAAGVIRGAMEELPLAPGAAELKPLADSARGAARTQFQALEADPAYKAAVNDSVPPDRFVQKFVTGPSATRDGVAQMKANLADNPLATQTMGVAAVDHLRTTSGIDVGADFRQTAFNKKLGDLGPRLEQLIDPKTLGQLHTIGEAPGYGLIRRGTAAVVPSVATAAGAKLAGPLGAMAGRTIGERVAEKIVPP